MATYAQRQTEVLLLQTAGLGLTAHTYQDTDVTLVKDPGVYHPGESKGDAVATWKSYAGQAADDAYSL